MINAVGSVRAHPLVGTTGARVHGMRTLARLHSLLLLALLPCLLLGLYNVGRQAGFSADEVAGAPPWQGSLVTALGADNGSLIGSTLHGFLIVLPILLTALITAELWRRVFARGGSAEAIGFAATALMFALALPPAVPTWQVAIGLSFGLVVGKEIFGGTGMNFLNPALVGLAFLYFSYPAGMRGADAWLVGGGAATPPISVAAGAGIDGLHAAAISWLDAFVGLVAGPIGASSTVGCVIAAVALLLVHFISWRVLGGALLGLIAAAEIFRGMAPTALPAATLPWYWHLNIGGFTYAVVFFACDPVTSATTNAGRWIYGIFIGAMTVMIRVANPTQTEAALLAVLLGSIVAPLIDYCFVRLNARRRRKRGG